MAKKIQEGNVIDWTNNTGSDVAVGAVVDLTTRVGVALTNIASGETGAVDLEGVYEETALDADAVAVGGQTYWTGSALTTAADDGGSPATAYTPAGMAVSAKAAATAGTVNVRIG